MSQEQSQSKKLVLLASVAVWLLVSLLVAVAALAVIVLRAPDGAALERVHAAGMELGNQMCMGFHSEMQRAPARRQGGGLL